MQRTALVSFVALIVLAVSACTWDRHYELKQIPVGDNRSIIILAETVSEISTGIYYQVKIGEETVATTCRICYAAKDPDSLNFRTIFASGGNLIAVYEEIDPHRILILHDFSRGMSWPRGAPQETSEEIDARGEMLLEQLQQEHPNSRFYLGGGGACGIRFPADRSGANEENIRPDLLGSKSVPPAVAGGSIMSRRYSGLFWSRIVDPPATAGGTDAYQQD